MLLHLTALDELIARLLVRPSHVIREDVANNLIPRLGKLLTKHFLHLLSHFVTIRCTYGDCLLR